MSDTNIHISIVCPVYGSPGLIATLCQRLHDSLGKITEQYEVILVFDCSPDNGWESICRECRRDRRVKGIRLSRNFGQHYAITAGLEHASGEWVVVMDCDLQDRPEEIPKLYDKAQEGYDIVFAQRQQRRDGLLKRLTSRAFYAVFSYMTETHQDARIANFGIYRDKVIHAIVSMRDYVRYFPTMAQWVGFESTAIPVEHAERGEGKSNYSWRKLFAIAFNNMVVFSDKPLRLTVKFGMTISAVTALFGLHYLWRYFQGEITVLGFMSVVLSIWFLSGIIIFLLGVLGIYLGKTFDQTKNRPVYIVRDRENLS
jgi:glycosyltransferase involved in cell wall biosynthesis